MSIARLIRAPELRLPCTLLSLAHRPAPQALPPTTNLILHHQSLIPKLKPFSSTTHAAMPNKYSPSYTNPQGVGDARLTAMQIVEDEGLNGKLSDKVFLITGCSSGIGIETARAIAATGAKVYLPIRDLKKGKEACGEFLQPGRVELLEMDLSSLASVRECAKVFLAKQSQLNVLVNNAGIMGTPFAHSADGFESQLATNHLGHFLLFNLLKDSLLKSSTPAFHSRVVNVSSSGHRAGGVLFDDMNFSAPDSYTPYGAYGQSKTANIYMANEIERRYASKGLHGLSVMPGGIKTNLQKHWTEERIKWLASDPAVVKAVRSPEQGAATTVYAAVGREWEGRGGRYLENCDEAPGPLEKEADMGAPGYVAHAYDEAKEGRLWKVSLEMVGLPKEG